MSTLFGGGAAAASTAASQTQGDTSKDVPVKDPPEDSVSSLAFSPVAEHLAVASWEKKVRIYEISPQGQSEGKAMIDFEAPVLSCAFSKDGTKVVGGGGDNAARMIDLAANQTTSTTQVAAHDAPVSCVKMFNTNGNNMLVTGSYDKTIKYWDLRQQNPVGSIQCQDRVYTMDIMNEMLVLGTSDRYINIVNLRDPFKFYKTLQSPLKWQTRVVSCFTDASGFAVGSVEGRCAIQYVEEKDSALNFSFKCHRNQDTTGNQRDVSRVFSVNDISFHPVHGTFSTAGSDGTFHFWDKDAKHRLKGYPEVGGTISATTFNRDGNIFAYAVSYDWSKGYAGNSPQYPNKIMLHPVVGDECKPRPGGKKR
ncbi:WD40 repeat-like protein [Aulographum hederae CBS 113979]|uniref:WD40 repeat-like protein n=1 Tax=Aulographum hederae CBS 113979 TaxID=1176131 RepID=A0A6G1H4K6_9PEZI|nr:WD40 repeat-like protein [Aulographum hederae CBS 113979]